MAINNEYINIDNLHNEMPETAVSLNQWNNA